MILASAKILISTDDCFSLKEKRKIVLSIKSKLRNKFNFSVAEIDYHDIYNQSLIGLVCISNDVKVANSLISKGIDYLEEAFPGRLIDYEIDIDLK